MFGLTHAPELDRPGLQWFNVDAPLRLSNLRGRIVLLDFWTSCCINCIHTLPALDQVAAAYPRELAVIGIHSPKYTWEADTEGLRQTLDRLGIHHPVIHDPERQLWDQYAVHAWPTLVLIGPDGRIVGQLRGEPDPERLAEGLKCMVHHALLAGDLHPAELPPCPDACGPKAGTGPLRYPAALKPGPTPDTIALADTGHHQVVLFDKDGRELRRIGEGCAGFEDGPVETARFCTPQGLACGPGVIYVADTGNHAVRKVDLERGRVETVAGQGWRGLPLSNPCPAGGQPGLITALASPWDVALDTDRGRLYVSNSGTHQILAIGLECGWVSPLSGSGEENLLDGPADEALHAQPSGLLLEPGGAALLVTDAEASAVRRITLDGGPSRVETLVGQGLFTFGHKDGAVADGALLQHPLALAPLAGPGGGLAIADTYNHAIRLLEPSGPGGTARLRTLWGPWDDLLACGEPRGLCALPDGTLLVADTTHHRILRLDVRAGTVCLWAGATDICCRAAPHVMEANQELSA